jgi:hypothetical protein
MLRNGVPLKFSPYGVSDAIDSTNVFAGAMAALSNLVPDPSTRNLWQCRPAANKLVDFNSTSGPFSSGWSSGFQHNPFGAGVVSTFISVLLVVGTRAYGMIANNQFAGHDVPFSYNLATNTFDLITGTTSANTPVSPATTGPWTPPSMALIGSKIICTHPGFNFGGGFAFGVLDVTTPTAPTWTAQNTTTNSLPALPSWVTNFNQRAWFLVNIPNGQPGAYFTDVLVPTSITNANQVVTFDDNQLLNVAAGLGLFNQLGGVIQSLMVFKSTANVYQITGDAALGNLTRNTLNIATGTNAPLSVTPTPKGLAFLAPDGLRLIDFSAKLSDPIGDDGNGINAPLINAVVPSRVSIGCNQNVLRVSLQNGGIAGAPFQEWWYDISRAKWSGPHTFPASLIEPYNNTFIMAPLAATGSLWQSDVAQSLTSTFVENGQQLTWQWETCFLPDAEQMCEMQVTETTLNMALTEAGGSVSVQALTQDGSVLGTVIVPAPTQVTLWGQFSWGQALWGGGASALAHRDLPWAQPLVFSRMQINATGLSAAGVKVGDMFLRYQKTGYLQRYVGAA